MEDSGIYFEFDNRYCPICGNFIKVGSPLHYCKDKDLKNLYKEENKAIEDRAYGDKLEEFEKYYDQDYYYNYNDEKE